MNLDNYVKGFSSYTKAQEINEMASSLTKLGVPKNLMQFIHKLSGKVHAMSQKGDAQRDPNTGRETDRFHTRKEPVKGAGGPWPEREDIPLSHDIEVRGTKTGKRNIYHYLTQLLDSRKDAGVKLILVNPNQDQVHYITRKTGKMDKKQLAAVGIHDEYRGRTATEQARELGTSNKRGLYMRIVTLDGDSGDPIAAWEGTIGQMADDMDNDSVLYIMEEEDRVRDKRKTRVDQKEVSQDQFIKYFLDNFKTIASKFIDMTNDKKSAEYRELMNSVSPAEMMAMTAMGNRPDSSTAGQKKSRLEQLAKEIESGTLDDNAIKPELDSFLKLAMKEGKYEPESDSYSGKQKASLSDMAAIHTLPTVASMFLSWIAIGKVYKKFYTDNIFKDLGIDDLLYDM
jgi:hypothetical protein